MRKRILHVYSTEQKVELEYRKLLDDLSWQRKNTVGKHNTRTILSGNEEHFFRTVSHLEREALNGQTINEYHGDVPHYHKAYLDHLVFRSNSE